MDYGDDNIHLIARRFEKINGTSECFTAINGRSEAVLDLFTALFIIRDEMDWFIKKETEYGKDIQGEFGKAIFYFESRILKNYNILKFAFSYNGRNVLTIKMSYDEVNAVFLANSLNIDSENELAHNLLEDFFENIESIAVKKN